MTVKNLNKIKRTIRIIKKICGITYEDFIKRTRCQVYGLKIYR